MCAEDMQFTGMMCDNDADNEAVGDGGCGSEGVDCRAAATHLDVGWCADAQAHALKGYHDFFGHLHGFRGWGLGFGVWGLGFGVWVPESGFGF